MHNKFYFYLISVSNQTLYINSLLIISLAQKQNELLKSHNLKTWVPLQHPSQVYCWLSLVAWKMPCVMRQHSVHSVVSTVICALNQQGKAQQQSQASWLLFLSFYPGNPHCHGLFEFLLMQKSCWSISLINWCNCASLLASIVALGPSCNLAYNCLLQFLLQLNLQKNIMNFVMIKHAIINHENYCNQSCDQSSLQSDIQSSIVIIIMINHAIVCCDLHHNQTSNDWLWSSS